MKSRRSNDEEAGDDLRHAERTSATIAAFQTPRPMSDLTTDPNVFFASSRNSSPPLGTGVMRTPDAALIGRRAASTRRRYDGPCPPEGPPRKYRFTIYALDLSSVDDAGTPMTRRKLRFIIRGHVLARASLMDVRAH